MGRGAANPSQYLEEPGRNVLLERALLRHTRADGSADADTKARDALKEAQPVGSEVNKRAAVFYMVHCAETDKQARENAERAFMSYVNTIFTVGGQLQVAVKEGTRDVPQRAGANLPKGVTRDQVNMDYLLRNRTVICGSPDTCIKQLEHIQKVTGLDHLMGMQQFWSIPHDKVMRSIELFGRHVIPRFARN
jgi:alkanesulfonate monooxygenase SsuD/methylene tetrahydromethanopterin reductase-like flavin-dependent oxidoreductase (luciferase family)